MATDSPFDTTAAGYDDEFTRGRIGILARNRFWRYVAPHLSPSAHVLDLGGGTGEDACHFASQGARITCTDASAAMVATAQAKAAARGLSDCITCRQLDMASLATTGELLPQAPFDAAYSNFGALNCVADLPALANGLARQLRPGAPVFLTVMGPCVPWEWGWYAARGQFAKAFRRLRRGGVDWRGLRVYYPSASRLRDAFAGHFALQRVVVINAFVPPSYCEAALSRHPRLLDRLDQLDERLGGSALLAGLADHYLAHLVRK